MAKKKAARSNASPDLDATWKGPCGPFFVSHQMFERGLMTRNDLSILPSQKTDQDALLELCRTAFPAEDLTGLLSELLALEQGVLSLIARQGDQIVGHVILTLETRSSPDLALLGPLAVVPHVQRQGIGTVLVEEGCARLAEQGIKRVCLLGDPAYYGRLGFVQETAVQTPCPIPSEWVIAWQFRALDSSFSPAPGPLALPSVWLKPDYWV